MSMSSLVFVFLSFIQPDLDQQEYMLQAVNNVRARGCKCGDTIMRPAEPVVWNETLYSSAKSHAKYLRSKRRLTHYGRNGEDIGTRITKTGYKWKVVGENLGEGQKTFKEVLWDWLESPSHCKMLMNPKVEEMAVARIGNYWVQHFGKKAKR